jgi:hypothetical protein
MQKTKTLGSLRNIFPPIHQPLPLNKRESARLLDTLKASFRAQLESGHGFPPHFVNPELLAKPAITYLASDNAPHDSARATDQHLHAIVSSPFLGAAADKAHATTITAESAFEKHRSAFSQAVQRGLMTQQLAVGFLHKLKAEVSQSATATVADSLRKAGAGMLVLQWLRMSGWERDLSFLDNKALTRQLVYFLLIEGHDDAVWTWIERLMKEGPVLEQGGLANAQERATLLVDHIIAVKAGDRGLDGAFAAVLRADAMRRENQLPLELLRSPWHRAAFHGTVDASKHALPPLGLFDHFVDVGHELRSRRLEMAHLKLHRPEDPSAELAVKYLSNKKTWENLQGGPALPGWFAKRLSLLGVDTVQHLVQTNEVKEASRIFDLLKRHLQLFRDTPTPIALV